MGGHIDDMGNRILGIDDGVNIMQNTNNINKLMLQ